MKEQVLLERLLEIPKESIQATVLGIEMQTIDFATREQLLNKDSEDTCYHECILRNGIFIFTTKNGILTSLYKVI